MKRKVLILAFLSLAIFTMCSKDFGEVIMDSFPFEFKSKQKEKGFVFEPQEVSFEIKAEKVIKTVDYFFSYEILEGEGRFELPKDSEVIKEKDTIKLESFDFDLNYVPINVGEHRILGKAWDTNGNFQEINIDYKVDFAPFTFIVNKTASEFKVNSKNLINVILSRNQGDDDKEKFKIKYLIEDGSGAIEYKDEEIEQNSDIDVVEGNTELYYIPKSIGEHKLKFIVTAPDGATRIEELTVTVNHLDFTLYVTPSSTQTELDTDLILNVNLDGDTDTGVTYEITHSYTANSIGSGTLVNAIGAIQTPGVFSNIVPGNYQYKFKSSTLGKKEIRFEVKDSNDQVKTVVVQFEVSNIPFSFGGSAKDRTVFIKQLSELNFNLSSSGNTGNVTYTLSYEILEGNGKVRTESGQSISSTNYPVNLGAFKLFYQPEELGEHQIKFNVTDNFGQKSADVVLNLQAKNLELDFNASADDPDIRVGERGAISVNLVEKNDYQGVTYQLSYYITGGTATLYRDNTELVPSQYFDITPGNFKFHIVPQKEGSYKTKFFLKDSNGQVLEREVTTVVGTSDYTIEAIASKSSDFVGETVPLTINIDEIPDNTNNTYRVFYSSSNNGSLTVGGQEYLPGSKFNLNVGSNTVYYKGKAEGNHAITFTAESGSGIVHTASTQINFEQVNYSFSGGSDDSSLVVGQSTNLNFNITENSGSSTYKIRYSQNGNGRVKSATGELLSQGNLYDIGKGNFTYQFEATGTGVVTLTFYVINASNVEKSVTIQIDVASKNFNLTTTPQRASDFANKSVPINISIEEIPTGANETYEAFYSSDKNGILNFNGMNVAPGTRFTLERGANTVNYTGSEVGQHNVKFTVISSSGVTKESTATITFRDVDFIFNGGASTTDLIVGQRTDFNFNINESSGNSTYKMRFSQDGNGRLRNSSGQVLTQGSSYDVNAGNFTWNFEATGTGETTYTFYVTNASGTEKTVTILVNVASKNFNFTATGERATEFANRSVGINLGIEEIPTGANETYEAFYSSDRNGTLTVNGSTVSPGVRFSVSNGSNAVSYTGTEVGQHNVKFTVISSSGVTKEQTVSINFQQVDFIFTGASQDSDITVGSRTNLNFNITENSGVSSTYKIRFSQNGNGRVRNPSGQIMSPGNQYDINSGNTSWSFEGTSEDDVTLTFVVTNALGNEKTVTIQISVASKNYEVTATPLASTEFVNSPVDINLNLREIPTRANETYQAYYTSSKNGTLRVNGTVVAPGVKFNVNVGSTTVSYTGTESGAHGISFTFNSSAGLIKVANTQINYTASSFNFSGGSDDSSITVGNRTNLNFNITESSGSSSSYRMRFQQTGNGIVRNASGQTMSPGATYNVNVGNFNWSFEGTESGNVRLTFYVVNDSGTENDVSISIGVTERNFNFSVSGANESFTGQALPVNFSIVEDNPGTDTYQMYFTSSSTGTVSYNGNSYQAGQRFNVPTGSFTGSYTGTVQGNHNVTFYVVSSSNVERQSNLRINVRTFIEDFTVQMTYNAGRKYVNDPINVNVLTTSVETHDPAVTYSMSFTFSGANKGYVLVNGTRYDATETIPINYGTQQIQFVPTVEDDFNVNFVVRNNTNIEKSYPLEIDLHRLPVAYAVVASKSLISSYALQIILENTTTNQKSEAFDGASIARVNIRIRAQSGSFLTYDLSINEFDNGILYTELHSNFQNYHPVGSPFEIYITDTNGKRSAVYSGSVIDF